MILICIQINTEFTSFQYEINVSNDASVLANNERKYELNVDLTHHIVVEELKGSEHGVTNFIANFTKFLAKKSVESGKQLQVLHS